MSARGPIAVIRDALGYGTREFGNVFIKADSHLPVAGSTKARGGVYEVFLLAETLARENVDQAVYCSPTSRQS
jgi:D-serine dehydratase